MNDDHRSEDPAESLSTTAWALMEGRPADTDPDAIADGVTWLILKSDGDAQQLAAARISAWQTIRTFITNFDASDDNVELQRYFQTLTDFRRAAELLDEGIRVGEEAGSDVDPSARRDLVARIRAELFPPPPPRLYVIVPVETSAATW